MKTKLLTAMIVCALLISLTGCAADKIASTPTQNVDVTMDSKLAWSVYFYSLWTCANAAGIVSC